MMPLAEEARRRAVWLLATPAYSGVHWPEKQNCARDVMELLDENARLEALLNAREAQTERPPR